MFESLVFSVDPLLSTTSPKHRSFSRSPVGSPGRVAEVAASVRPGGGTAEADSPARLLAAAGPIFAAKGFDAATLREIASVAGTNVAAISYHFGDKLGLYRAVWDCIQSSRVSRFPVPDPEADDTSPAEAIRLLVHTMLSRMLSRDGEDDGWQHLICMQEMQRPSPVFPEIVNEYFRPVFELLTATLRRFVGPEVGEADLHRLALSVVGQCLYYRTSDPVLEVLLTESQIRELTDIAALAEHITRVTVAAAQEYRR